MLTYRNVYDIIFLLVRRGELLVTGNKVSSKETKENQKWSKVGQCIMEGITNPDKNKKEIKKD